ncbi:MAG: 2-hydroxyacyl-CoA dehydratase [Dehalococcoidales bacterium]|nr:2-hydroxyacyl-CoA dehydratase [Dehalococcoidales bacterium]
MESLNVFNKYYRNSESYARNLKNEGVSIVGYVCNFVPEELIIAAGFFPLRLGSVVEETIPEIYEKFLTSGALQFSGMAPEDFVARYATRFNSEKYDFIDYLVIPRGRDSIHHLYSIICDMKQTNTTLKAPEPYFIDKLHTKYFMNQLYNREQVLDLKSQLEKWSGKFISDKMLSESVAVCLESEILLKRFAELRASNPPRISGVEALQVIGSSFFMPKNEHNILLREFINRWEEMPVRKGKRIFVSGSPIDNLQLYEIIESRDAVVIGEDHCWGNRNAEVLLTSALSPIDAVVEKFNTHPLCPGGYPLEERVEYCVQNAIKTKAGGVVCYVLENDHIETWEVPTEIKKLAKHGIPVLHLKRQPYIIKDPEKLTGQIDTFLQQLWT